MAEGGGDEIPGMVRINTTGEEAPAARLRLRPARLRPLRCHWSVGRHVTESAGERRGQSPATHIPAAPEGAAAGTAAGHVVQRPGLSGDRRAHRSAPARGEVSNE